MNHETQLPVVGGIEAGGTKFICAVGSSPQDVRAEARFLTKSPEETLGQVVAFFRQQQAQFDLAAIGLGSFGPLDPNPRSPTYGYITATPKPGWSQTDIAGIIQRELNLPVAFDTDVNAAAMGEYRWGAAHGLDTFIYLTIGTGIGGGAIIDGSILHGLVTPEMGHIMMPHDLQADPFPGVCPFHGDCFEGLASGPAMAKRWGQNAEMLPQDHPAWELEANYIALALVNYACILSPERMILGGGVMSQAHLFPMIRKRFQEILNGYLASPAVGEGIDRYIQPPGLGGRSGVMGAIALAQLAYFTARRSN
jgi:fructokinase